MKIDVETMILSALRQGFMSAKEVCAADTEAPAETDAPPAAAAGVPTLYLYDFIGGDWMVEGVTAQRVIADLETIGEVEQLDVHVNSGGGDVFEGVAIYNALARYPGKVVMHVDALAASIASLIAMAGDEIVIAENAMFMVHHPYTIAMGDADEMRATANVLDKTWSAMLTTYQRRTGKRAASIEKQVQDAGGDWYMTAAEAVAAGFADRVEKPVRKAKASGLRVIRDIPASVAAALGVEIAASVARPAREFVDLDAPRVVRAAEESAEHDAAERDAQERRRRLVAVMRASLA